jgi:diadenosine tetraphosphate (Ap4A) HIT family hydrolase
VAPCSYCFVPNENTWAVGEYAFAVPPLAPVTRSHCIILPRRHVARFYELDVQEQHAVWELVRDMRKHLAGTTGASRFQIGFADFASEDEGHAHIHVIPCAPGEPVGLPRDVEWVKDEWEDE